MSAKYSQEWNSSQSYNCFGNFADPCAGGPNKSTAHLFTLNDEHTFSKTLLLTTTLGFTRGTEQILAYNGAGGVTDPVSKLGFPSYLNSNGFMGVPSMFIDQGTYYSAGYTSIGGDPYGNYRQGPVSYTHLAGKSMIRLQLRSSSCEGQIGTEALLYSVKKVATPQVVDSGEYFRLRFLVVQG